MNRKFGLDNMTMIVRLQRLVSARLIFSLHTRAIITKTIPKKMRQEIGSPKSSQA